MTTESNYCVYAELDKSLAEIIFKISLDFQEKYKQYLKFKVNEYPHITLCYGPSMKTETELVTFDKKCIDDIIPNFLTSLDTQPSLEIKNVDYFTNDDCYVIKIRFSSYELNKLRKCLRDNSEQLEERMSYFEKQDGYVSGSEDYEWAHSTVMILKNDTPTEIVADISEDIYQKFFKLLNGNYTSKIMRISLISAVTDTEIPLKIF